MKTKQELRDRISRLTAERDAAALRANKSDEVLDYWERLIIDIANKVLGPQPATSAVVLLAAIEQRCIRLANAVEIERLRSAKNAIDGWSEDHTLWAAAIAKEHDAVAKAQCEHAKWALAACIFALRGQSIDTSRYDLPMEVHEALKFKAKFDAATKGTP